MIQQSYVNQIYTKWLMARGISGYADWKIMSQRFDYLSKYGMKSYIQNGNFSSYRVDDKYRSLCPDPSIMEEVSKNEISEGRSHVRRVSNNLIRVVVYQNLQRRL